MIVFGDGHLERQLRLDEVIGQSPGPIGLVFLEKEEEIPGKHMHRGKVMWGHRKKLTNYNLGREGSPETNADVTLILNLQPPD